MPVTITSNTRLAGVIGWPIAQSRSPLIHNYWLQRHNIDGAYFAMPVEPQNLRDAVYGLRALGYRGANVTLPHKEKILEFTDRAGRSGAPRPGRQHAGLRRGWPHRRAQHRWGWFSGKPARGRARLAGRRRARHRHWRRRRGESADRRPDRRGGAGNTRCQPDQGARPGTGGGF